MASVVLRQKGGEAQNGSTRIGRMSLFTWLKAKSSTQTNTRSAPLLPAGANARSPTPGSRSGESAADIAARRKSERARLRELLYNVVRESMVRVGILSSSFKFKVLATDPKGRRFIVMMDLARDFGSEIAQLAEIETLICQVARARHNIVVSSVYWRSEGQARLAPSAAPNVPAAAHAAEAAGSPAHSVPVAAGIAKATQYEPVLTEEVNALKRALAAGSQSAATAGSSNTPNNYGMLTGYETTEIIESELPENDAPQTEILDDDARFPALSPTQYGDLQ